MTFSFSLRVTIWQVVQTAFSFFLVRHLCTRASRPQHLSSAIFLQRAHGLFIAGERMVPSRRRRIPIIRAQAVYTLEIWGGGGGGGGEMPVNTLHASFSEV